MERQDGWGPSHQTGPRRRWIAKPPVQLAALGAVGLIVSAIHFGVTGIAIALILGLVALVVIDAIITSRARPRAPRAPAIPADGDPLRAIRALAARAGGGVWLGAGEDGQWKFARPERAVLLLGPPRSGKTSGVIIPAVLAHAGPAIVTSTKPDVARATARARARDGRVWMFDPTGASRPPAGLEQLRWSPVTSALTWDGAVVIARAMTVSVGVGTADRSHWSNRAQALLAPLLHAAAVHGKEMKTVVDWFPILIIIIFTSLLCLLLSVLVAERCVWGATVLDNPVGLLDGSGWLACPFRGHRGGSVMQDWVAVSGVRVRGPLAVHVRGFAEFLDGQGYAAGSVHCQLGLVAQLSGWLARARAERVELTELEAERFLAARRARVRRCFVRGVRLAGDQLSAGGGGDPRAGAGLSAQSGRRRARAL